MTLGAWGQVTNAAGNFFGSEYLKDYAHASAIFRTNSYQNAPKLKFLFHTYFEINPDIYTPTEPVNFGVLVKEVRLPSFTMKTHQLNQYNRKRIVQSKITYDPVEITFHDDNNDAITKLWQSYYQYYYYDGSVIPQESVVPGAKGISRNSGQAGSGNFNSRNIYDEDLENSGGVDWGFKGGQTDQNTGKKIPFFKTITIYGLHQHKVTSYTLINPIITNFTHDTYNYEDGQGVMTNRMTIDYESVVYNFGQLSGDDPGNIVTGFGELYDKSPSPIMQPGANRTVLGQGGLVDSAGGSYENDPYTTINNAKQAADLAYNTYKNPNLNTSASDMLDAMLKNSIKNTPTNRNSTFNFPGISQSPGPLGLANSPTINALQRPPVLASEPNAGYVFDGSEYLNQNKDKGFPIDVPFGFNQFDINNDDDTI